MMQFSKLLLMIIILIKTLSHATSLETTYAGGYVPAKEDVLHELGKMPRISLAVGGSSVADTSFAQLQGIESWPGELIYDQGTLGSCTANSMAFIIRYLTVTNSSDPENFLTNPARLDPSRLFHYWNTRSYEGKIYRDVTATKKDSGASIVGAILAMDKYGCCPESFSDPLETLSGTDLEGTFKYGGLPYNVAAFTQQPTPEDYRFALDSDLDGINTGTVFAGSDTRTNPYASIAKNLFYEDLSSTFRKTDPKITNTAAEIASVIMNMRAALAANKPIYLGLELNKSFFKDKEGFIPTPSLRRFKPSGGHAIAIVGHGPYDTKTPGKNYFKFVNSWGTTWGDRGFGYLADDYIGNISAFQIEAFSVSFKVPAAVSPVISAGAGKAGATAPKKKSRKRGRD